MGFLFAQAGGFEAGVKDLILNSGPVAKLVLLLLMFFSVVTWAVIGAKWLIFSRADRETGRFLRLFRQHGSLGKILTRVAGLQGTPLFRMLKEGQQELQALSGSGQERGTDEDYGRGRRDDDSGRGRRDDDRGRRDDDRGRRDDDYGRGRRDEEVSSSRPGNLKPEQLKFISTVLQRAATEESGRLELALPFLATTGSTAPFIGLFGTVWGVMAAFQGIGASNSTSIAAVAPGISEALIATAAGLVAAIPAVMGYNHFMNKLRKTQKVMDSFGAELLDYLEKRYCGT